MAATAAISGALTTLSYTTVGGSSYTSVGELSSCSLPEITAPQVEATHYTSQNGYTEMISSGWKSVGEINMTVNHVKTQVATLYGLIDTQKDWKILLPDSSMWTGTGSITKFSGSEVAMKDVLKTSFSINPTGKWTFTASGS